MCRTPTGSVNVTLTVASGNADMFVGYGNGTGPTYTTNTFFSYTDPTVNGALFWTGGSAPVKTINFGLADLYTSTSLLGYYAVTVLGLTAGTQFSLSVSINAPPAVNITTIPVANKQQVAGSIGNTGYVVYAFNVDGSAGANSDVMVLVQPDLTRAVVGVRTELEFTISTVVPASTAAITGLYWNTLEYNSITSDVVNFQPALQPIAYALNAQAAQRARLLARSILRRPRRCTSLCSHQPSNTW